MRTVGGWLTGGGALDGRIAGLRASVSPAGVGVTFRHVGTGPDTRHLLAVAVDGDLYELVPSEGGALQHVVLPGTLPEGGHRVDVVPVRAETRHLPDLHGVAHGRRAYLRWPASESEDLARYLIYSNGGDGAVDYATPMAVVEGSAGRTEWSSGELSAGTWRFSVRAEDRAGNLSGPLAEFPLAILHLPNPVRALRVQLEASGNVLLRWSHPQGPAPEEIDVYSNHSATFGRLAEDILEDGPFETLPGTATELLLAPPVAGVWKFQVRARDLAGRRSDSIEAVEVDTEGLPTGIRLNAPEQVIVVPGPGGSFRVSWLYRREGGEDLHGFIVYEAGEVPIGVASAWPVAGAVSRYEATVTGPYSNPQEFLVAAIGPDGCEMLSEAVLGVPDNDPPVLNEPLEGASN